MTAIFLAILITASSMSAAQAADSWLDKAIDQNSAWKSQPRRASLTVSPAFAAPYRIEVIGTNRMEGYVICTTTGLPIVAVNMHGIAVVNGRRGKVTVVRGRVWHQGFHTNPNFWSSAILAGEWVAADMLDRPPMEVNLRSFAIRKLRQGGDMSIRRDFIEWTNENGARSRIRRTGERSSDAWPVAGCDMLALNERVCLHAASNSERWPLERSSQYLTPIDSESPSELFEIIEWGDENAIARDCCEAVESGGLHRVLDSADAEKVAHKWMEAVEADPATETAHLDVCVRRILAQERIDEAVSDILKHVLVYEVISHITQTSRIPVITAGCEPQLAGLFWRDQVGWNRAWRIESALDNVVRRPDAGDRVRADAIEALSRIGAIERGMQSGVGLIGSTDDGNGPLMDMRLAASLFARSFDADQVKRARERILQLLSSGELSEAATLMQGLFMNGEDCEGAAELLLHWTSIAAEKLPDREAACLYAMMEADSGRTAVVASLGRMPEKHLSLLMMVALQELDEFSESEKRAMQRACEKASETAEDGRARVLSWIAKSIGGTLPAGVSR